MRKPSLSVDTFLAAFAVLGVTASIGCSKQERLSSEPSPSPPAVVAPGAAPESPAPSAAPETKALNAPAADPAAPPPATAPAQDKSAPALAAPSPQAAAPARGVGAPTPVGSASAAPGSKKGNMACGASGCSPDMKKNNGN